MEQTLPQAQVELTTTTVEVPTDLWLQFRSEATRSGSTAKKKLIEAIRQWLESQPN
jgi:hypothetical protein